MQSRTLHITYITYTTSSIDPHVSISGVMDLLQQISPLHDRCWTHRNWRFLLKEVVYSAHTHTHTHTHTHIRDNSQSSTIAVVGVEKLEFVSPPTTMIQTHPPSDAMTEME